jgi:hypothetical protein
VHKAQRFVGEARALVRQTLADGLAAARWWRSEVPNRGPPKATKPAGRKARNA